MSFFVTGAELDSAFTSATKFRPGQRARDEQGRWYIFTLYNQGGGVTGDEGLFGALLDSEYEPFEGTADSDNAHVVLNLPIGQYQTQLADGEYGWQQYSGENRKPITTDGNVVQGDLLKLSAAADGIAVRHVAGYAATLGVAKADDVGTTLAAGTVNLNIRI